MFNVTSATGLSSIHTPSATTTTTSSTNTSSPSIVAGCNTPGVTTALQPEKNTFLQALHLEHLERQFAPSDETSFSALVSEVEPSGVEEASNPSARASNVNNEVVFRTEGLTPEQRREAIAQDMRHERFITTRDRVAPRLTEILNRRNAQQALAASEIEAPKSGAAIAPIAARLPFPTFDTFPPPFDRRIPASSPEIVEQVQDYVFEANEILKNPSDFSEALKIFDEIVKLADKDEVLLSQIARAYFEAGLKIEDLTWSYAMLGRVNPIAIKSKDQELLKWMLEIYMSKEESSNSLYYADYEGRSVLEAIDIPKDETIRAHYTAAVLHFFERGKQIFEQKDDRAALAHAQFCTKLILKIGDEASFGIINNMAQTYYNMGRNSDWIDCECSYLEHAAELARYTYNHNLLIRISEHCKTQEETMFTDNFYSGVDLLVLAIQISHDPAFKENCLKAIFENCPSSLENDYYIKRIAQLIVELGETLPYPANMNAQIQQQFEAEKTSILARKTEVVAAVNPTLPPEIAAIAAGYTD